MHMINQLCCWVCKKNTGAYIHTQPHTYWRRWNQSKYKPHPSWNFSNVFIFFRECILSKVVLYHHPNSPKHSLTENKRIGVKFQFCERERTKAIARHTITNARPQAAKLFNDGILFHGLCNKPAHNWVVVFIAYKPMATLRTPGFFSLLMWSHPQGDEPASRVGFITNHLFRFLV